MLKTKRLHRRFKLRMTKRQQIRKKILSLMKKIVRRIQKQSIKNKQPKSPTTIKSRELLNLWLKENSSKRQSKR